MSTNNNQDFGIIEETSMQSLIAQLKGDLSHLESITTVKELFVQALQKQINGIYGNGSISWVERYLINPDWIEFRLDGIGYTLSIEGLVKLFNECDLESTIDWDLTYPFGSQLSILELAEGSQDQEWYDNMVNYRFLLSDGQSMTNQAEGTVTMTEEGIDILWNSFVEYYSKNEYALAVWEMLDLHFDSSISTTANTSSTTGEALEESVEDDISNSVNSTPEVKMTAQEMMDLFYPIKPTWFDEDGNPKKNLRPFVERYNESKDKVLDIFDRIGFTLPKGDYIVNLPSRAQQRQAVVNSLSYRFKQTVLANCSIYTRYFDPKSKIWVPISVGSKDIKTKPWDEKVVAPVYGSFAQWFHNEILSQLEAATPEDFTNLIRMTSSMSLGSYRNVPGSKGVIDVAGSMANEYIRFDFDKKSVLNNRGIERHANEKVYFGNKVLDSKVALYVLAVDIITNGANQANAKINGISSLWKRDDNYGASMAKDDVTKVILDNLCLAIQYPTTEHQNIFPFVQLMNGKQQPEDLELLFDQGIPTAPDKYNIAWLTTENGFSAMMLGIFPNKEGDLCVASISDMSKIGKVYNRPPQNSKYLRAESPDREVSPFMIELLDGTLAKMGGIRKRAVWTNSRLVVDGSGVVRINAGVTFSYYVPKKVKFTVSSLRVPSFVREYLKESGTDLMDALKDAINSAIHKMVEEKTVIKPGEVIMSLFDGKYVLKSNDTAAQELTVVGGRIVADLNIKSQFADSFDVILETNMIAEDSEIKVRGLGLKATTVYMPVKGFSEEWDIMLNNEATKGFPALIHMFVIAQGGGVYKKDATVLLNNGTVVDFKQPVNAFTEWAKSVYKTEEIRITMARSVYEELKAKTDIFKGDDFRVVDKGYEDHVVIYETVKAIYGDLFFDVEVSTAREAIGTSSLTLEQIAASSLQLPRLAETLSQEAKPRRKATRSLVEMMGAIYDGAPGATLVNLSDPEHRESFRQLVGNVSRYNLDLLHSPEYIALKENTSRKEYLAIKLGITKEEMESDPALLAKKIKETVGYSSDRSVFAALKEVYPNGVMFEATSLVNTGDKTVGMYIRPDAIEALAAFSGGAGVGIASDIIAFLTFVTDPQNEGINRYNSTVYSMITKISSGLNTWTNKMVESAGVLKKVSRAGRIVTCKVRTTFSPIVHSTDGIPVVAINPNCPLRRMLRVKDGDIIAINRTPMPFLTGCRVRFSTQAPMYHIMVDALTWAKSNEGDSDGDGIGAINLKPYDVTEAEVRQMNSSLMGMAGYYFCYSKDELPFAGFMSYKDKFGKKDFTKLEEMTDKEGNKVGIAKLVPIKEYVKGAALVAKHYRFNVGIGYGVCSALTFSTVNLAYSKAKGTLKNTDLLDWSLKACVVAWRLVYEGLGLSGHSSEAAQFFNALFAGVIAAGSKNKKIFKKASNKTEQFIDNCEFFGIPSDFNSVELDNAYYQKLSEAKGNAEDTKEVQEAYEYLSNSSSGFGFVTSDKATVDDVEYDYIKDMISSLPEGIGSNPDVQNILFRIVNARRLTYTYSRVERGAYVPKGVLRDTAAMYGALRRIGQGDDPVEVELETDDLVGFSDEIKPASLFSLVEQNNLCEELKSDFLRDYLEFGTEMYSTIIGKKLQKLDAEIGDEMSIAIGGDFS